MPKGYCDALKIGDYLGLTLTPQQYAQATQLVPAVEAYIDRCTGRAWLAPSPVTDELHVIRGPVIYLNNRPVTTLTSVTVALGWPDAFSSWASPTTLVADSQYLLVDPTRGEVWLTPSYHGYAARITYTHGGPALPADLALAATMLGAHWLQRHIDGASGVGPGIKSYSVGQELSVTYADSSSSDPGVTYGVPDDAAALIDGYRAAYKVFA